VITFKILGMIMPCSWSISTLSKHW